MGSVKDLTVLESPGADSPGRGRFLFSDRYSVFDWGEMPDHVPRKGAAIAILGAHFFEKLEELGFDTHYIGIVENGKPKKLDELKWPSNEMEVRLLNVHKPELMDGKYDYSVYSTLKGCFLIPLEVIYRNVLPEGSSVFKRLERGELSPGDIGLDEAPRPGQALKKPMLDVSTKLEITDRYLKWDEARDMAGLTCEEEESLGGAAMKANSLITEEFAKIGLVNEDGKFEFGFGSGRKLMFVDVLGTLDECRFTYRGMPVSKEIARVHYRKTKWFDEVEKAKTKDRDKWKDICPVSPEPLPGGLLGMISDAYCACANEITGRKWFGHAPALKELLSSFEGL